MSKWGNAAIYTLACFVALIFYRAVNAGMFSGAYRILITEQTTVGNSALKMGGAYSLLGSTGQLGCSTISGGAYTMNMGIVNSWRPAQNDVSAAHAYPNPCNIGNGCYGVTFTRLTLKATVRIFTISGELVSKIEKNSSIDSIGWDLKNLNGRQVASGLYIYHSEGNGTTKTGKLVIVR